MYLPISYFTTKFISRHRGDVSLPVPVVVVVVVVLVVLVVVVLVVELL